MNASNKYFTGLPFLLLRRLFAVSSLKRFLFFFSADAIIIVFSLYLSFLLRFDFKLTLEYEVMITKVLPLFLVLKLSAFALFRMYKITWRYVGLSDLQNIVLALTASESLLMVLILIPLPLFLTSQLPNFLNFGLSSFNFSTGFPRSIFLIDWTISLVLLSGLRISKRVFLEIVLKKRFTKTGKRTIIIGAGNTGEMILRDIARQNYNDFCPAGFLDDDKRKIGTYIHGVKVIGSTDRLKYSIRKYDAEAVIIAIPALNHKLLKDFYETSKAAKIGVIKIVPRIYDFHKPDINLKGLEDISIEDLIGRQAVEVNYSEIEHFIKDKVVLITGAGGSIGSEITIQVCSFNPARVFLLDIDETGLHNMEMKLNKIFPGLLRSVSGQKQGFSSSSAHLTPENRISFIVADIKDKDKISRVFETLRPQIVFHAAAYKHVPMMEYNSDEAVKVNILGTYNLATTATEYNTEKFIMISTDKAVMPTSVMGATKRVAEYICKAFNGDRRQETGNRGQETGIRGQGAGENSEPRTLNVERRALNSTEFISVRFGNVLGSRGSVLPLFMEQLKNGGPLTITHKDMQRYFMTIPEAVSLVLQASVIGGGGEVLVLDMGEPVKIVSLAEELIRIHGLEPYKDIDIEFVGLRAGEKLFEEILTAEEGTTASRHEKVYIARQSEKYSIKDIEGMLKEFGALMNNHSVPEADLKTRELLKKYVKHYEA